MNKIKIGSLVVSKAHPYLISDSIKIGANINHTPPIMIAAEFLNSNKFDTESTDIPPKKIPSQVFCYFYSSKNGTIEKHWFSSNQISLLNQEDNNLETTELGQLDLENNQDILFPITIPTKEQLKAQFLNKEVILKSANSEINKQTINISNNLRENSYKLVNFVEFLPPIMSVIDIIENKNFIDNRVDEKTGNIKKISTKFFLKCKWFNHVKQTYSEDLIPPQVVENIIHNQDKISTVKDGIKNQNIYQLEIDTKKYDLILLKEIICLNHITKLIYRSILTHETKTARIDEKLNIIDSEKKFKDFFASENPVDLDNLILDPQQYYHLKYVDRHNRFTTRIITNCRPYGKDHIEAKCLLRNGDIRHFRLEGVEILQKLKDNFSKIIQP